jgi:peptide/nickel transport system ATP-binding protein/oligopeptide transport system ATP-binding protein
VSYLFIAHDLALVRHVSHRVSVMYLGRIVETGTREDVFERAAHPYTQALISAMGQPRADGRHGALARGDAARPGEVPSGCAYRTRCPKAQAICASDRPALVERGQGHPVACHFADLGSGLAGPGSVSGSAPDARIDRDDGDVGDEVDEGDEQARHDADPHDEGGVQAPQP